MKLAINKLNKVRLNNKGFVASSLLYSLLLLFLALIIGLLTLLSNRKMILDKLKKDIKEEIAKINMYDYYENGTVIYYNPVTGKLCNDYTEANSKTEVKEGCLKWYIFNDKVGNTNVNMLLDHNTSTDIAWISEADYGGSAKTDKGPITANNQLNSDTENWNKSLNPRLISADEVAMIVGKTDWDSNSYFYFHNPYTHDGLVGGGKVCADDGCEYGWLYDRTFGACAKEGCLNNAVGTNTTAYWTSSKSSSTLACQVFWSGLIRTNDIKSSNTNGIRPVITISKKSIKNVPFNAKNVNKIYGIRRSLTSSSTTWERINDSVGLEANAQIGNIAVKNDFDNIYPWKDIISYNYNTTTKNIKNYIGDTNFKFDGSNGEVLTHIPEFYYKREQKDGYEYIYITKDKIDGYIKSEGFSVGRYTMSGSSGGVHSRSGYAPLTTTTIANFRNYARNLGEGFGQIDYHYFILQMLYLVEYADYNSQVKLGQGNVYSSSLVISGGCNNLGMKSGTLNNDGKHSMIYRGIEDIFGNIWQFVDGIKVKDHQTYICYDQSKYEDDINKTNGCYKAIGYTNSDTDGYISKLGYDASNPLVALPTMNTGSDSTYISDYYLQSTGEKIALVGGYWNDPTRAGLWYWNFKEASSFTWPDLGVRLLKTS